MKIKFLGTAAAEGMPGIFCDCEICRQARQLKGKNIRTRSQAVIDDILLVDFPPDTYFHTLRDGLELHKIHSCIITHAHPDHFYPEDFIMRDGGFATLSDDTPLTVYCPKAAAEKFDKCTHFGLNDRVIQKTITAFESFDAEGYHITPLAADHRAFKDAVIYLIEKEGKMVLYAHDTGYFPEATWKWLGENKPHIDFATFDCCYGLKYCHSNHMGFETVCEVRERLSKLGLIDQNSLCCINHFSHNVGPLHDVLEEHAKGFNFLTAYDGMEVTF